MANTKISQLPLYSGTAADLRWFVMNNSGETETFKFSGYTSPFRYTNNTFSSNNTYDTNVLPGSYNKIIGGFNHTLNGNYNAVIGGYGHNFPNQYSTNNFVGGGLSHTLEGGDRHGIIGGSGNYFYGGEQNYGVGGVSNQVFISNNSGIIGGEYCSVYNNGFGTKHNGIYNGAYNKIVDDAKDYNTIINGSNNVISGTTYYGTIVGGEYNTLSTASYSFIGGGKYNILSGGTNYSSIVGGLSNENYGNYSGIFNGTLNKINNPATEHASIIASYSSRTEGDHSHIFGGLYNQIFSEQSLIVGGRENIINAGTSQTEMFGCRNSVMSGSSIDVSFINTISGNSAGFSRIVMAGTTGRTATRDDATFVDNLVVFNYAALDFANDAAAAAGGVVLGQIYHHNGNMKIRIV